MRTEQAVLKQLALNAELPTKGNVSNSAELTHFPKPTLSQLAELLEERILPDRRTRSIIRTDLDERRSLHRRKSD